MNYYDARQHSITERWTYTCRNGRDIYPVGHCAEDAGHDTPEEACACYRTYLIETARMGVKFLQTTECKVCREATDEAAMVNGAPFFLCEDHMDEESLAKVYPAVGSSISS